MKSLKQLLSSAAIAGAMAASAQAGLINVAGVMWDPDNPLDFGGITATILQSINPLTGEVTDLAVITSINGTGVGAFCPGCELTARVTGYFPVGGNAVPTPADPTGTQNFYGGGSVQIYLDHTPDAPAFNPLGLTLANATDGVLWMELTGHEINGISLTGTNNFAVGFLQGKGLWDVAGGLAAAYLNTNSMADGADFSFTNTFTSFPTNSPLFATGSGTFNGDSIALLSESGTVGLIGLGLLALGLVSWYGHRRTS